MVMMMIQNGRKMQLQTFQIFYQIKNNDIINTLFLLLSPLFNTTSSTSTISNNNPSFNKKIQFDNGKLSNYFNHNSDVMEAGDDFWNNDKDKTTKKSISFNSFLLE